MPSSALTFPHVLRAHTRRELINERVRCYALPGRVGRVILTWKLASARVLPSQKHTRQCTTITMQPSHDDSDSLLRRVYIFGSA